MNILNYCRAHYIHVTKGKGITFQRRSMFGILASQKLGHYTKLSFHASLTAVVEYRAKKVEGHTKKNNFALGPPPE